MPLRLIQIGVGGWGRNWVEEVTRDTPGVEPVAWVDTDAAARERAIVDLGLPRERVFGSLEEALQRVAADAALVVVPLAAHALVTRQALEAGLHALVEKPFAETIEEARALARLAQDRARVLMVNQNYRWFPAPRLARCLLRGGAVGRLVSCYIDFHQYFGTGYRYFSLKEPLLSDMAIHHFDALRFVLDDEPAKVSCHSWAEPGTPFAGHPAAVTIVTFAKGTVVSYRGSWLTRGPATPYGGHWRLDGTRGTIEFTFRGAFEDREKLDRLTLHRPGEPPEAVRLPEMPCKDRMGALDAFARWIREGEPPEGASTATDNLKSLALMFAAIRSARHGGATTPIATVLGQLAMTPSLRVTVWNEFRHERSNPQVAAIYPDGIHEALAGPLRVAGLDVRTATLDQPEHGLGGDLLETTDVLLWWGHQAHAEVGDATVDRIHARVLEGMGLIALHSAHFSKIFKRLMGTSCDLKWRVADERERLWVVAPGHPVVAGLPERIELAREEMYGEPFDIPPPDELVLLSWFQGGEVFRSGCCFRRGAGRIFYFRPGHETYPTYHDPAIQQVIGNAVRWAAPTLPIVPRRGRSEALERIG